jgi:hypothetical protein
MKSDSLTQPIKSLNMKHLLDLIGISLHQSLIQLDLKEVETEINLIHQNNHELSETFVQSLEENELRHRQTEEFSRDLHSQIDEMRLSFQEFQEEAISAIDELQT